jgi:hypothetical protein
MLISASGNRYTCLVQIQPSVRLANPALHALGAINLINSILAFS